MPVAQLVDLFALVGNTSVSVPGVRGIGVKTAAKLLEEHHNLATLLTAAPTISGKPGALLQSQADEARLAFRLLALRTDVQLGMNLNQLRLSASSL